MSEVDHDDIAKKLVDSQQKGQLESEVRIWSNVISESTILAIAQHLNQAIRKDLSQAEEIYEIQKLVCNYLQTPLAVGYLKCQLATLKASTGDYKGALRIFEEAMSVHGQHFEQFYIIGLHANLVAMYVALGKVNKAKAEADTVKKIQGTIGQPGVSALARTETNLGILYRNTGQLEKAAKSYRKANELFVELDKNDQALATQNNLGIVLRDMGHFAESRLILSKLHDNYCARGLTKNMAHIKVNLGILEARCGNFYAANNFLATARSLYESQKLTGNIAEVDIYNSVIYIELGLYKEALASSNRGITTLAKSGSFWIKNLGYLTLGLAAKHLNKSDSSRKYLEIAAANYRDAGAEVHAEYVQLELASLCATMPQIEPPAPDRRLGFIDLKRHLTIAKQLLKFGNFQEGQQIIEEILRSQSTQLTFEMRLDAYRMLGECELEKKDYIRALQLFSMAIDLLAFATTQLYKEEFRLLIIDLNASLFELMRLSSHQCYKNEEINVSELFDSINASIRVINAASTHNWINASNLPDSSKINGPNIEHDLRTTLGSNHLWDLSSKKLSWSNSDNFPNSRTNIGDPMPINCAEGTFAFRDINNAQIFSIESIISSLTSGDLHFQFYFSNNYIHALVISNSGCTLIESIADKKSLFRTLEQWRFLVSNRNMYASSSTFDTLLERFHDIFDKVIRSVQSQVINFTISLPASCHDLPFHAFRKKGAYLIQKYNIAYRSWLSAEPTKQQIVPNGVEHAPLSALIVSNSLGNRFPNAVAEGEEVNRILQDNKFETILMNENQSKTALTKAALKVDIIHVASHSSLKKNNPLHSTIHVSVPPLTVLEISQLKLARQPLVILNACRTGTGNSVEGAVVGFVRYLLLAGASSVIGNLWEVNDYSSRVCIRRFYEELMASEQTSPSHVLNKVQRELSIEGIPVTDWASYAIWSI